MLPARVQAAMKPIFSSPKTRVTGAPQHRRTKDRSGFGMTSTARVAPGALPVKKTRSTVAIAAGGIVLAAWFVAFLVHTFSGEAL